MKGISCSPDWPWLPLGSWKPRAIHDSFCRMELDRDVTSLETRQLEPSACVIQEGTECLRGDEGGWPGRMRSQPKSDSSRITFGAWGHWGSCDCSPLTQRTHPLQMNPPKPSSARRSKIPVIFPSPVAWSYHTRCPSAGSSYPEAAWPAAPTPPLLRCHLPREAFLNHSILNHSLW